MTLLALFLFLWRKHATQIMANRNGFGFVILSTFSLYNMLFMYNKLLFGSFSDILRMEEKRSNQTQKWSLLMGRQFRFGFLKLIWIYCLPAFARRKAASRRMIQFPANEEEVWRSIFLFMCITDRYVLWEDGKVFNSFSSLLNSTKREVFINQLMKVAEIKGKLGVNSSWGLPFSM